MGGSNYLINTLRDRIEFITEQHLQGKSSKLILFVLSQGLMTNTSLREAALRQGSVTTPTTTLLLYERLRQRSRSVQVSTSNQ